MKQCIFPLLLLALTASCNRFDGNYTGKHDPTPQASHIAPDTLWTPTGDAKLDSLLQLAAVAPQDTNLARLYHEIGEMYEDNDFEKAKAYFLKLQNLSEQLGWNEGYYLYASDFANILNREGLTDSALAILQKAYDLAEYENNEEWTANLLSNKGTVYFIKEWYETALDCYLGALPIFEKKANSENLKTLYFMMSQLYQKINIVEKAIEYGEKTVALNREDEFALFVLATSYSADFQNEKVNYYLEEALRAATLHNNIYLKGTIYWFMANEAMAAFDLNSAEKYNQLSLEINRQFGRTYCSPNYIILCYLEKAKGNFVKAEEYVREALEIATETETLEEKRMCYIILAELSTVKHNYRENIRYLEEVFKIEREQAKTSAARASEEMAAKYETAKKDFEIERQQNVIAHHNMQRWLLAGGIAVCVVFLALLWYMLRLRNRRNTALTERNNALAEINATKDKFFNIISHDLQNPAVALNDALKTLVKNGHIWDTDTLTAYYCDLLRSSEGHIELITHLLNWAKAQTGRIACTPEKCYLADQLRPNVTQMRDIAAKKGVTLANTITDDIQVEADVNILSTVVRNLLTNAVKFTPAGGTVTLSAEPAANGRNTLIAVSDTGIGMTREQLGNLFHLDSIQSRPGTTGEHGSGLGLIVCRDLLEKHGATLHVESEADKGSRFWFEV